MKGINKVVLSGNAMGKIDFARMPSGIEACTFRIASGRYGSGGELTTAYVKVNVYIEGLVKECRNKLAKGVYVLVEGELMNRAGVNGELTEIRAKEIIFPARPNAGDEDNGTASREE